MDAFKLAPNASLELYNTFKIKARAAWLAQIHTVAALPDALSFARSRRLPVVVLSGGSNVLITRDINGLVLHPANRGIDVLAEEHGVARIRVSAGENWDHFVRVALQAGFSGLENLILIPGAVGAAPIQNIGAYGTELSEFVDTVEAWDRRLEQFIRLDHAACEFGYRNSIFKSERGRYIVTAVEFRLARERPLRLDYAGIRQELRAMNVDSPTPMTVGQAVERLRRRKLPDPSRIGNAGSFFKNPVVSAAKFASLRAVHPQLRAHPYDEGQVKLSAAWLIEACGLKGVREKNAGVSEKHALVLVNHGDATGAELWALAVRVQEAVAAEFSVTLEPEPVIL